MGFEDKLFHSIPSCTLPFSILVLILCNYFAPLSILQINNAAVNFNQGFDNTVEYASQVITTNYYGTKNMIQAMIPLMKPSAAGARIVNVSSRLGRINGKRSVSNLVSYIFSFVFIKNSSFLCMSMNVAGREIGECCAQGWARLLLFVGQ